jgi:hypothetical protein
LHPDGTVARSFALDLAIAGLTSIVEDADGKFLVSGHFTDGWFSWPFLVRYNPEGTLDTTFTANVASQIVPLPDGKLLAFNGSRLKADGSLDETFVSLWADNRINAILPLASGEVLLGGMFTTINGLPRAYLARLLAEPGPRLDISLDSTVLKLSWPSSLTNHILQTTERIVPPDWQQVAETPQMINGKLEIEVPISGPARFFRLRGK